MLDGFLLLRYGAQHISRARNMREVDLGLDLFFAASSTGGFRRTRRRVGSAAEMFAHQVRFVIFQGTGVRLLLRHAHRGQHVKNFLALDFQLTGQIVDSNLTHPPSFPFLMPRLVWGTAEQSRVSRLAYLTSRKSLCSLTSGWLPADEVRASGPD
jgi:hypothetical protein